MATRKSFFVYGGRPGSGCRPFPILPPRCRCGREKKKRAHHPMRAFFVVGRLRAAGPSRPQRRPGR